MSKERITMNSKYGPLESHLRDSGRTHMPLTFGEIEHIIGAPLPPAAFRHRALWSNNASNWVGTKAWLAAGYETENVDMQSGKLVFRKSVAAAPLAAAEDGLPAEERRRLIRSRLWRPEGHGDDLPGYGPDRSDRRRMERRAVTAA